MLAVELDHELALHLRVQFPPERVTVVEQDVLQFDFAAASAAAGERLLVVGNLPYGITSPILLKLAASHAALDRAVLMVQREVADRVTAQPGSRDYGLLSVTVQMYGPAQRLFTLPPSAFSPPPEVHSTVFRWRFAPRFAELGSRRNRVSCASFARPLRRNARRWPTTCALPEFRPQPSPPRWPQPQSTPWPAPKPCPSKPSRLSGAF